MLKKEMFDPAFIEQIKDGFDPEKDKMDRRILYEVAGVRFDPSD